MKIQLIAALAVLACGFVSLTGCGQSAGAGATTQLAVTAPPPTLLQVLQTAYTDAQAVVTAGEASGLIQGTTATEVNGVLGTASDALQIAAGSPNDQALLNDAAAKVATLVQHPTVVSAKQASNIVVLPASQ